MNTIITSQDAERWLERSGYDDLIVQQTHIERFLNAPEFSSHALIAMLCIAKSAETPQDYEEVYFSVRAVAEKIHEGSTGAQQNQWGILREATVARGEMTKAEFNEKIYFKAIELGVC